MAPQLETVDGAAVPVVPVPEEVADQAPPPRPAPVAPAPPSPAPPTAPRRRGRPPRNQDHPRVSPPTPAPLDDQARAAGVQGIMQIGAGITLLAGKATGKDAFKADAVAIASVAEETAAACVQIAKTDPKFAAALDRVCAVGPYGALITIATGLGLQIARNHRPDTKIKGTRHPDELLEAQRELEERDAA